MKRLSRMLGVTLLEIMLVLAIAAMIIMMSIRYYQSASSSQQVNAALSQIQGIVAAADSLAQATGSYSAAHISNSTLQPLLPANSLTAPWGGAITVTAVNAGSYTIAILAVPPGTCQLFVSKITTNAHIKATTGTCSATASSPITLTYNASTT